MPSIPPSRTIRRGSFEVRVWGEASHRPEVKSSCAKVRKLQVKAEKCKPDFLMKSEIKNRVRELADRLGDSATFMTLEELSALRVPESETINPEADDIALGDHTAREGFAMLDELENGEDGVKTP
jgi:hypothetical protein